MRQRQKSPSANGKNNSSSSESDKKNTKSKKHLFSATLTADSRVSAPPRLLEPLKPGAESHPLYMVKVYPGLETPGSELLTISCVLPDQGVEYEMRFDERYPVAMRFKTQTDQEKITHARSQIERAGGFEKLAELFASVFPKFRV